MIIKLKYNIIILSITVISVMALLMSKSCFADIKEERLVFVKKGDVYTASFKDSDINIEKISKLTSDDKDRLIVSKNGKEILVIKKLNTKANQTISIERSSAFSYYDVSNLNIVKTKSPVALSPNRSAIAYVVNSDSGMVLRSKLISSGEIKDISDNYSLITGLSWSPDGTKLAYFCETSPYKKGIDGGLRLHIYDFILKHDIELDGPMLPIHFNGDWREDIIWSPNGKVIYYEKPDTMTSAFSCGIYETHAIKSETPKRISDGICTSISSNGDILYITDNGSVFSIDTNDLKYTKKLIIDKGHHAKISPSGEWLAYLLPSKGLWCINLITSEKTQLSENSWLNNIDSFSAYEWISDIQ